MTVTSASSRTSLDYFLFKTVVLSYKMTIVTHLYGLYPSKKFFFFQIRPVPTRKLLGTVVTIYIYFLQAGWMAGCLVPCRPTDIIQALKGVSYIHNINHFKKSELSKTIEAGWKFIHLQVI